MNFFANFVASQGNTGNIGRGAARLTKYLLGTAALSYIGYKAVFQVDGGHRAVMFSRLSGVKPHVYDEGLHFRMPWFEWPTDFEIRTKATKISSPTGTKDLQTVNIALRVLYKPQIEKLPEIFRETGTDFAERVLPSIANETLKAVVAQFNASQLITRREEVSMLVKRNLSERARDFHILLDDVSIVHIAFSSEYSAAVEAKQVAQQEAERGKFLVEKAIQDKKSAIIKAEGESQSATLIGNAIKDNPGFVELRRLQAAADISNTVSHAKNRVYLDADTLLLNLNKDTGVSERMKNK